MKIWPHAEQISHRKCFKIVSKGGSSQTVMWTNTFTMNNGNKFTECATDCSWLIICDTNNIVCIRTNTLKLFFFGDEPQFALKSARKTTLFSKIKMVIADTTHRQSRRMLESTNSAKITLKFIIQTGLKVVSFNQNSADLYSHHKTAQMGY